MTNKKHNRKEYVEILEYWDNDRGLYFHGTKEEFEEFKKYHKIYPYHDQEN